MKLLGLLILGYALLVMRLFYIQVIRAPYYKEMAQELTLKKIVLPARRGTIFDRNGNKLAVSVEAFNIGARPTAIKDKEGTAAFLAPLLKRDREELLSILKNRRKFTYLARRLDFETGSRIKKEKLPGIDVESTTKRIYPGKSLAAHIIGFTNVDGKGIEGLERKFNRELKGSDGYVIAQFDARGKVIPGTRRERIEPVNGDDLVLTIDSTIQHAMEESLAKDAYEAYSAAGASAVMIDPKTGEILALANMPTFDLNHVKGTDAACRRNRAVTDLYEPGSTLKTMTVCAALQENAISATDTFACHGSKAIGKRTIRCVLHGPFGGGHGAVNAEMILRVSCNIGAAGVGMTLGAEKLYEYEEKFGMYERPGTEMPGEALGWHDNWKDWPDIRLSNIAFGQGIAITPLQMTKAYSAVANDGVMMKPHVVKEIRHPDGTVAKKFVPREVRRILSADTARKVGKMLYGVVSEAHGTGKPAQVEGYMVGGKTGSAQKAGKHGYEPGKFVASFIGYLPVSNPTAVILVAVDEPKGMHWGATCAAPVFQKVARKAMWHMKVPPDGRLPDESAPSASGTKPRGQASDDEPVRARLGG